MCQRLLRSRGCGARLRKPCSGCRPVQGAPQEAPRALTRNGFAQCPSRRGRGQRRWRSFEERALPPSNLSAQYSTFDFDAAAFEGKGLKIEVSEIAPAFGHPGGGLQVRHFEPCVPPKFISVTDLRDMGILS
ncbi:TNT domain-containing protein [Curtobacterium sp. 'Ferrero']|uniref:TNT domain-containing protein n=1 Tax=Curtobacterium sp. 'Ferrero' TaxID=2033654 RepID=UPI0020D0FDA5|nr:TNT domain-containing protein [Curtobacterium sp. 'Ferrero']